MKLLRVKANHTENKREHFILIMLADKNNKPITETEMFGYVVDEMEGGLAKYPFIINATNSEEFVTLNYGADSEYATSKINIPKKKLEIGEYFTRLDDSNQKEYIYIISNITEIIRQNSIKETE